ncbi:MAG TPA: hypothetical protein VKB80_37305 [Kofleriaceae bacterium]|nr:hypothetical protein [Kofleriaceae bacterium]
MDRRGQGEGRGGARLAAGGLELDDGGNASPQEPPPPLQPIEKGLPSTGMAPRTASEAPQ